MRRLLTSLAPRHLADGFTIVELLVAITVSGLLMAVLFGPLNDLYIDNSRGLKSVIKVSDTRGALRSIEHNISLSYSFYHANQITDPSGTVWSWIGSGASSRVLITGNYATSIEENADTSNARTLLYASGSCSNNPVLNNYIYFVNNGTLYRRTIKNTAALCSGSIAQKQTCAANVATAAHCQGVDATILTGVTNFSVDYYANPYDASPLNAGGSPAHTLYTDNTAPATAKSIVISVTSRSGPGASDTTTTSTLRITRLNGAVL